MDAQLLQTEIKRKLFHAIGLIYVVGLYTMPRQLFITCVSALLIFQLAVELLRLNNLNIHFWFKKSLGTLMRGHEENRFTGVVWMTLGVLITSLIVPSTPLAATAVLYLILGDGVASLAGKFFQGPRWADSSKRISGSLACFMVCVVIGIFSLRPEYGWHFVLIGALTATVFELNSMKINDNFLIPVASAVGFILTNKLWPN